MKTEEIVCKKLFFEDDSQEQDFNMDEITTPIKKEKNMPCFVPNTQKVPKSLPFNETLTTCIPETPPKDCPQTKEMKSFSLDINGLSLDDSDEFVESTKISNRKNESKRRRKSMLLSPEKNIRRTPARRKSSLNLSPIREPKANVECTQFYLESTSLSSRKNDVIFGFDSPERTSVAELNMSISQSKSPILNKKKKVRKSRKLTALNDLTACLSNIEVTQMNIDSPKPEIKEEDSFEIGENVVRRKTRRRTRLSIEEFIPMSKSTIKTGPINKSIPSMVVG
jgi:hypothetical protein